MADVAPADPEAADAPKKEDGGYAAKGANGFINYVNPKLVNFTKPLMLAMIIGAITLAGVIIIWMGIWSKKTCTMSTVTARADFERFKEHTMSIPGFECIVETSVIEIRAGVCFSEPVGSNYMLYTKMRAGTGEDPWSWDNKRAEIVANEANTDKKCFVQSVEECTVKGTYQTMDLGYGSTPTYTGVKQPFAYCEDSALANKAVDEVLEANDDGEATQMLRHCAYQNLMEEWTLANKAVTVQYRVCSQLTMTAALGAALGYQSYVELLATIVIITLFLKMGIVETSDLKNFKDLIMADGKAVMGSLKTEVKIRVNKAADGAV